ncbi:MAG: right-handed parallel beta-helix repeat-containing protein, partial [Gammaproteobacteria bacterium]|nr:right-handed parallel beta-helix repeat-containing protein [Gammaproteobacteria bacterium]
YATNKLVIEQNRVFDNNGDGVVGYYDAVVIQNNESFGNRLSGIAVLYGAQGTGNVAWNNASGLYAYSSSTLANNRSYANNDYGIHLAGGATATGNRVYGNVDGGAYLSAWDNVLTNNLLEGDGGPEVILNGAYYSGANPRVENNTIVVTAPGKDAIVVQAGSRNVRIVNNIIDVRSGGYALNVAPDSEQDFVSDYNLFALTNGSAVALWETKPFVTRTDWFYEVGMDQHSVTATAGYVDLDDVQGWVGTAVAGSAKIVDDGDATFTKTGTWTASPVAAQGRGGDTLLTAAIGGSLGVPTATASWRFDGLAAGYYKIAVTWPYGYYQNGGYLASNASYTAYQDGTVVGQAFANQQGQTNGFTDSGSGWSQVMLVKIDAGSLEVQLDNVANSSWVMADGVRIEQVTGDFGQDDDVHLAAGSAAIDRGDPLAKHQIEPVPNGNRLELGAYGNPGQTTASANPQIQVLGPNGLEKLVVGAPTTVSVRTAGLLPYDTVMLLNAGTGGAVDNWLAPQYRTDQWTGYYTTIAAATAIDLSTAGANAAPGEVYRTIAYVPGGAGYALDYDIPLADGDYQVVLHFIEPNNIAVGQRLFDVAMNGTTVQSNLDVRALSGGYDKALAMTYATTVSGGQGLAIALKNVTTSYTAMISGIEIRRLNAQGTANPTVSLEASLDNGTTWATIATGVALDRYGRGQAQWTPTTETSGNTALIRATATMDTPLGTVSVSDVSDEAFLVANGGHTFYVNDGSTVGDEYATATGNNANSGKDAAHPMASLAALLRAYDLSPGDVVYVDTGSYQAVTNVRFGADDSGITVQGAQQPGHATIINRANTNTGAYVLEFQGADDVTLSNLSITGGAYGVVASNTADSDHLTIASSRIYGNSSRGLSIDNSNEFFTLTDSQVYWNSTDGMWLTGADATVTGSEVYRNGGWGIQIGPRGHVYANDVYGNNSGGIYAAVQTYATNKLVIEQNRVFDNNGDGVVGYYDAVVIQNNESFGNRLSGIAVL